MMAVNKPPGLVVHPGAGNWKGTFVNALIYHLEKAGGTLERTSGADMRPGIVHRIDKGKDYLRQLYSLTWVFIRPVAC